MLGFPKFAEHGAKERALPLRELVVARKMEKKWEWSLG
jgi:hypothetical protein